MPWIHKKRLREVNEKFFDTWSPEMSYVLGLWFADGNIYHSKSNSYVWSITSKDIDILNRIRDLMGSSHKITLCTSKSSGNFVISSKNLYDAMRRFGGCERKSYSKIEFPDIKEQFLPDFVRGYIDGDGCIYAPGNRPPQVNILGSEPFLTGMMGYTGLPTYFSKRSGTKTEIFDLKYHAESAQNLLSILYHDDCICMSSKLENVAKAMNWKRKRKRIRIRKFDFNARITK